MKTEHRFATAVLRGVDERVPADPESADLVQNFTREVRTNAWDNRIGYEKFFTKQTAYAPWSALPVLSNGATRIDSLFIWNRHNGAQEFMLHETRGALLFTKNYQNQLAVLQTGREIPSVTEACTQYIPMGRWIIILNGYNRPVKWSAWPMNIDNAVFPSAPGNLLYDVGWDGAPSPPEAYHGYFDPGANSAAIDDFIGRVCSIPNGATASAADLRTWNSDSTYLGSTSNSVRPAYYYKVTFVNNTGSESPISGASTLAHWENADYKVTYGLVVDIPRGPEGTIARRIYRTNNQGGSQTSLFQPDTTLGDGIFRYVGQIDNNIDECFVDTVSDSELAGLAPSEENSIPMPAPKARFGAVFKSCLFLDGGAGEDARLYWSYPGTPDTFEALSFMDLSGRPGGAITGLYAYYNMLLVFREGCIDVVHGDYATGFQVTTLRQGITCRSPNTIATIPNVGVIFMAEDGIYILSGSMDGGSEVQVNRISDVIRSTIDRVNKDALARATGTYSQKWKEYHVYFPADGEDKPTLGIVFHVEQMVFSLRSSDFPVGCIDSNLNGDLIFGHHTGALSDVTKESGLFVISRARQNGYTYTADTDTYSRSSPPISVWRSPFHDFARPEQKKYVKYVYLYVMTTGSNKIPITYTKDYELTGNTSGSYQMQMPDRASQNVWNTAVVGTDVWERPRVTEIRYPIADGACSHFQFEIATNNDIVLIGYAIDYQMNATKIIRGKR